MRGFFLVAVVLVATGCSSFPGIRPFRTDGCTLCPDGSWRDLCVEHDVAYWRGGTIADRWQADVELFKGVRERTNVIWASIMFMGVRIGGFPYWPTSWRWGYGWGYGRGYEGLSPDEKRQADSEFELSGPQLGPPPKLRK